jgi:hypothetical protein
MRSAATMWSFSRPFEAGSSEGAKSAISPSDIADCVPERSRRPHRSMIHSPSSPRTSTLPELDVKPVQVQGVEVHVARATTAEVSSTFGAVAMTR